MKIVIVIMTHWLSEWIFFDDIYSGYLISIYISIAYHIKMFVIIIIELDLIEILKFS